MKIMKAYFSLLLVIGSILFATAAAGEQPTHVISLTIRVTTPDGKPAPNIPIQEVGIERIGSRNHLAGKTNARGELVVHFQRARDPHREGPAGYGVYRYAVMPKNHRWELSDTYCWNEYVDDKGNPTDSRGLAGFSGNQHWYAPDFDGTPAEVDASRNWTYGQRVPLRAGDHNIWEIQLQAGKTIKVKVVDQFDEPVPSIKLRVWIDFGHASHTGRGGELPSIRVETDAEGKFTLEHVGPYAYSIEGLTPFKYYTPNKDYLDSELRQNFLIQGTLLRYQKATVPLQILVRDRATEKPIHGAKVGGEARFPLVGVQGGPMPLKDRETNEKGLLTTPPLPVEHYVRIYAEKEGYLRAVFDMKEFKPGEPILFEMERDDKPAALRK